MQLTAQPIAGRIGAEIKGVQLSGDLPSQTTKAINEALLRFKVIFFRNQNHLSDEEQERFSLQFGELVNHPTVPVRNGTRSILELDSTRGGGRANQWHTDVTFVDAYPKISILRGVEIPDYGGDTVWANTVAAYQDLPPQLKDLADKLWAVHSNGYDYAAARPNSTAEDRRHYEEVFTSTIYTTEHPVVRVHPETGERSLVLGNFVQKFIGFSQTASDHLYELLQSYVIKLENTVRWRWTAGDVAIWDNRATQHYAISDYGNDQARIVRRTTIAGDVPVSLDGRRSKIQSKTQKSAVGAN